MISNCHLWFICRFVYKDKDKEAGTTSSPREGPKKAVMEDCFITDFEVVKGYGSRKRGGFRVSCGLGTSSADSVSVNRAFFLGPVDRDDEYGFNSCTTTKQQELDQVWLTRLTDWYQLSLDAKQPNNGRRSKFKRPREAPAFPDFGTQLVPQPTKRLHLEADEAILFSCAGCDNHDAVQVVPLEQKKWVTNVELSGGRAERGLRKRQREGELDSWAKIPNSTLPMQGDFRSEPIDKPVPLLSASSRSVAATWKAVLVAAEAFENNLSDVRLDSLLDFFEHVRRLPPPSQVLDETTRIAQTVNECLGRLWKQCTEARKLRAKWMDLWHTDGVEIDAIRKALKVVTPLVPDEFDELERQLSVVSAWQCRLDEALSRASEDDASFQRDDLGILEALAFEADTTHGFRSKGIVNLHMKLQKTYEMREKLRAWEEEIAGGTVKTLGNLVRDILRLKIRFPEANELFVFSRNIEAWVERADIAIRSRISFQEIEDLIRRGLEYRLDVSEYLEKLQGKAGQARDWLNTLKKVVDLDGDTLQWMAKVRTKLEEGDCRLHDLACEGSRLPVEVEFVKLIQIELDARQWSAKARRWLPNAGETLEKAKQGKIEELREHLKKASTLRDRLPESDRISWTLDLETELIDIVEQADKWFEKEYNFFFEGDNRKATSRRSISLSELRLVEENGCRIPVNLGTAQANISRYLIQAETWYGLHKNLLVDAGLENSDQDPSIEASKCVLLDHLKSAMDDANNSIAFELKEVENLSCLIEELESWFENVSIVCGTGKRRTRGKKVTYTIDGLRSLIKQSSRFPIDTSEAVEVLEERISAVESWQVRLSVDLGVIGKSFDELKKSLSSSFGEPDSFCRTHVKRSKKHVKENSEDESISDMTEDDSPSLGSLDNLIQSLAKETSTSIITTPEAEIIVSVEHLYRWLCRSIKYLSCNDDIFDRRFYGAFDRFLGEGQDLQNWNLSEIELSEVSRGLVDSCNNILYDQMRRMKSLLNDRDVFSLWCRQAGSIVGGDDKRFTPEQLEELTEKAMVFPKENELVKQVKELNEKVKDWIARARKSIASEQRLKLLDLKNQIEEGEKLGIQSLELRELKNGLKAARSWANRVKKCKPGSSASGMVDVNSLVEEYDSLMVEMPDEIAKLNKAIGHYCICRGQFGGHMLQCDECKDHFHASCLSLSKARAEKMEKFICVRCALKKMYQSSSSTVASIIRKWTSEKELHKARQVGKANIVL